MRTLMIAVLGAKKDLVHYEACYEHHVMEMRSWLKKEGYLKEVMDPDSRGMIDQLSWEGKAIMDVIKMD